ncbi:MAG: haloacid dehalogenase-like hydrolase [Leptospira sp.]|nr:haloacid dehalogenase-like hydrolase [Leptospira sp.]
MYSDNLPAEGWSKDVHSFLDHTIQGKRGIAAFDFDNTLIRNDFGEALMFSLIEDGLEKFSGDFGLHFRDKKKAISIWEKKNTDRASFFEFILAEYSFHLKNLGVESAYRWTSFLFSGWEKNEMMHYARKIWNRNLNSDSPASVKPYKQMQNLVSFLKFNGWDVFIVTASPAWIIEEVSSDFLIDPGSVIGMNLKISANKNTPEIIEPFTYGQGKVRALSAHIGRVPDLSFGDSENDLFLLESAKIKGILLDKGDLDFQEKCRSLDFLIQRVFK